MVQMVGLRLDFAPFQPSHLRHVYTPRSPASPLESIAKRVRSTYHSTCWNSSSDSDSSTAVVSSGPPPSPYKWMWYCHQCRTGYEIGVTRRCLIDDHELCYGQPVKKRTKKGKKKNQACQSEFDYSGWKTWGAWKRTQAGQRDAPVQRDCSKHCEWPSQCRWACKQEQEGPASCKDVVQEPASEDAHVATPQTEEPPVTASSEQVSQAQQPVDGPLATIATAARRLTSQWTSLLAPIPEEPLPAPIEEFLNPTTPNVDPMKEGKQTASPPTTSSIADTKSSAAVGMAFDFGFSPDVNEATPSFPGGIHDLVARTVGIALIVPLRTCLEQNASVHRRCASAPAERKPQLQEQLRGARRMSA
ncbi:MAG: hypothetical protein LQ345_004065 [Seirophora villosa]|nr:MAG: hypothetical protein LQ345_004065 [Seirophora villosa]